MTCPRCGGVLENWSDPGMGSFGNACLVCKLFVWDRTPGIDATLRSKPLDQAPFPRSHTRVPAYRSAVGWVGPIQ